MSERFEGEHREYSERVEIYTAPEAAKFIAQERRQNDLERRIAEWFKKRGWPEPISLPENSIVLARAVSSVKIEELLLIGMARYLSILEPKEIKFQPVFWEYTEDVYRHRNPDKRCLGEIRIYWGKGRGGGLREELFKIIDGPLWEGSPISQIKTIWGGNLVEFHHEMKERIPILREIPVFDISEKLKQFPGGAKEYYPWFLAHFIDGKSFLFEDFHVPGFVELDKFRAEIVYPALKEIEEARLPFPLIIQIKSPPRHYLEQLVYEEKLLPEELNFYMMKPHAAPEMYPSYIYPMFIHDAISGILKQLPESKIVKMTKGKKMFEKREQKS